MRLVTAKGAGGCREILTKGEVAVALGVSEDQVDEWVKHAKLQRFSRRAFGFQLRDVNEFIVRVLNAGKA